MGFKKRAVALCLAILSPLLLTACSESVYRDGKYSAQAETFENGWKEIVEITVERGELKKVSWDAIYQDDSIPIRKKQYSKSGLYGMLAAGAGGEWYDQAAAVEQFVVKNGAGALGVKDDGYTDAVAGCTIHVNEFERLLLDCLQQARQ